MFDDGVDLRDRDAFGQQVLQHALDIGDRQDVGDEFLDQSRLARADAVEQFDRRGAGHQRGDLSPHDLAQMGDEDRDRVDHRTSRRPHRIGVVGSDPPCWQAEGGIGGGDAVDHWRGPLRRDGQQMVGQDGRAAIACAEQADGIVVGAERPVGQ